MAFVTAEFVRWLPSSLGIESLAFYPIALQAARAVVKNVGICRALQ